MARNRDYTIAEDEVRTTVKGWSVMDIEDLRDYAKVMTIDDPAAVMMRSRVTHPAIEVTPHHITAFYSFHRAFGNEPMAQRQSDKQSSG